VLPDNDKDSDLLLTINEVAELLKLPAPTVYSLTRQRAQSSHTHPIPHIKVARRLRFRRGSVLAWLAGLEVSRG
jgi:excisionase family DNA binding protein